MKAVTSEHKDAVPVHIYLHIYKRTFVIHWNRGFIDYLYFYGVGGGDEDEGVGDDGR